ncbi:MAG: thioredoxin domain-containing protein [Candidatus Nanohaloarchaea archaeon]
MDKQFKQINCVTLYEFYGKECPHCQAMEPKVERLEEEKDFEVKQLEVWHNKKNAEKQKEFDDEKCGGVPFFYNTESEEWICGETGFEELVAWARGEEVN